MCTVVVGVDPHHQGHPHAGHFLRPLRGLRDWVRVERAGATLVQERVDNDRDQQQREQAGELERAAGDPLQRGWRVSGQDVESSALRAPT
jgi:hypothetical protein